MPNAADFEKLGVFYLGRRIRPGDRRQRSDDLILYDSKDLRHPRRLRRHDRQRQDGPVPRAARRGGDRRHPGDRHRPQGRPRQPAAHLPEPRGARTSRPWVNEDDARRKGVSRRRVRRAAGRAVEEGARRVGPGRRAHPAPARRGRLRDLHARQQRGHAGLDPQVVRRAARRPCATTASCCASASRTTATSLLGAARHRRRSDPEPRAHPDLDDPRRRVAARAGPRPRRRSSQQIQTPPVQRVGVLDLESFFPAKERFALAMRLNNLLAAPGFAAGWRASRSTSTRCCTRPTASRAIAIFSIAHLGDAERMFFVSLLLNQVLGWMRDAARHDEPARAALHGRDLRLLPAGRESAVEGAAADAAQAGARVRPGRGAGDAEPGRPRLQGARPTPAPGSSAGCRPSATRRACSTGSKARPHGAAEQLRPRRDGADPRRASATASS